MSSQRPDVVNRLDKVSEAITSLHRVLAAEESLEEVLARVARSAVGAVVDVDAVSITVRSDGQWRTAAYPEERVLALDDEQYASRRGPCLEAAQLRRPVRIAMDAHEQRWPEFVAAARADGVRATLSVPLIIAAPGAVDEDELVGSVNAYSRRTAEFDLLDEKLLCLFADTAGQAVLVSRRWKQLGDNVAQLQTALGSRADIDQAKGALRVLHGGTAEEAFAELVQRSQRENVKLRDLARQVIGELSRRVPPR